MRAYLDGLCQRLDRLGIAEFNPSCEERGRSYQRAGIPGVPSWKGDGHA